MIDGGGAFLSQRAPAIFACLGDRKEHTAKREPGQSLFEAEVDAQRRMVDSSLIRAATWADLLAVHGLFVAFSYQACWAYRQREDGWCGPAEVPGWIGGDKSASWRAAGRSTFDRSFVIATCVA